MSPPDILFAALTSAGRVVAWGLETYTVWSPYYVYDVINVPVEAQSDVVAISAGTFHGVALRSSGQVVAWGLNNW
jgi:alpha-tubulin suppressor-like RCC1 family protein